MSAQPDTFIRRRLAGKASARWVHDRVDESWKAFAACKGLNPALWFPRGDDEHIQKQEVRNRTLAARAVCRGCPVTEACLAYAIELDFRYGTWGGMTEKERGRLTGRRPE